MDPIEAYLDKHQIAPMLDGIVNELVADMPKDPISFIINGLLKAAAARGQEPDLLLRLQELKQTLMKDEKEASAAVDAVKKVEADKGKLEYRVTHLNRTIDELEKSGGGGGGGGSDAFASVLGVPPGHTAFSWTAGAQLSAAPAAPAPAAAANGTATAASGDLTPEKFSKRIAVGTILNASDGCAGATVVVCGWVRTNRVQKKLDFMSINDGSSSASLQCLVEKDKVAEADWEAVKGLGNGAAVRVEGTLKESPGQGQKWELMVGKVEVIGPSDGAKYPVPPAKINVETLRGLTHMRPRTNVIGAVMRIRNSLAYATHTFFQSSGFMYVHAPLITGADCEGAGEMFQVTTMDMAKVPTGPGGVDYTQDFFGKPAYLTVSGQLNGEYYACAFGSIYTFGPTFRAENSNTTRHLAEFWMIEPEIAFCDLTNNMDCAEGYLRHCFRHVLANNAEDLAFLEDFEEKKKQEEGLETTEKLRERLRIVADNDFARCSYTEAVEIVKKVPGPKDGTPWEFPPKWGEELQTEHEKYLAEVIFKKPVIVYNYPKGCKAFYMRLNDDNETVGAMDVLFPRVGEMVGGSQREERLDVLLKRMKELDLKEEDYSGYLDTRRFGSQPHAGFGVGFERLVLYATAMGNIRDVIPFPRTVGQMLH